MQLCTVSEHRTATVNATSHRTYRLSHIVPLYRDTYVGVGIYHIYARMACVGAISIVHNRKILNFILMTVTAATAPKTGCKNK